MDHLKVLWFNWRCIKHPLAGGAEVYTHEIARRLVSMGNEVYLVTSQPKSLPREEVIDGYNIIRRGNRFTVYLNAIRVYKQLKREGWVPDVVVDEINTIPFMTPLYVEEPIVVLIHQLCKECWKYAAHPLLYPIGWGLEKTLHKLYVALSKKLKAVVTVSNSTKNDLIELGYPPNLINIVHNGIKLERYRNCIKPGEKEDVVVYLGRISPYKRLEDLLKAWKLVERKILKGSLVIAGRPDPKYLRYLISLAKKLSLKKVYFRINLSHEEKISLLSRAKALVYTSALEGWGQSIMEALACGAPTIAYDVPGLRDAVKILRAGILVRPGDIVTLAQSIIRALKGEYLSSAKDAEKILTNYTWDKAARSFLNILKA